MSLCSGSKKLSAYCSNVRQIAGRMRAFSTQVRQEQPAIIYVNRNGRRRNNLLGPNKQYPFPGDVTSQLAYEQANKEVVTEKEKEMSISTMSLDELLNKSKNEVKRAPASEDTNDAKSERHVELKATECPKLLRNDLKELFKGIDLSSREVSVLNLTQKTETDMSAWSMEMEVERMQLTSGFIESATAICNLLKRFGYWADFIDPSSGRPFLGQFTNATLFETDDRYRSLGFKITDLGCCKVLEHVLWGKRAFVGTIFTDAPIGSSAVEAILAKVNSS